eukprot:466178_1
MCANYTSNESTFMLNVSYDTPRKLFMSQGYQSTGLNSEYDYHVLSIHGFSLFKSTSSNDTPSTKKLLIVDIDTVQGVGKRVRISKEEVDAIAYLPAVVQEEKLFRALIRHKWISNKEVNHYRIGSTYRPKWTKGTHLWHKTIRFDNADGTVHKMKVLGVEPHEFIGQTDAEYHCRSWTLRGRNVYVPEALLFDTEKEATNFELNGEDLLNFLYFNSLESAAARGIDIGKVIESEQLPEWLQISSPFYNKKNQYLLYQDTNANHYFLQRAINEVLLHFTNPTIVSVSHSLKMTAYNITKYGVAISYNSLKEIVESNMDCVSSIVPHPDYIEFKINIKNTDLDTMYNDFKKGHKNEVVGNEVIIRYIRKYEALLMTDFS